MSDTYSIVQGDVPGGPPVNLPPIDVGVQRPKAERLRITVGAKPQREGWQDYPLASESEPATGDQAPQEGWQAYPLASETESQTQPRQVGAGEAVAKGAANALSFGTSGAIAGLGAAAGQPGQQALETEQQAMEANPWAAQAGGGAMLAQPIIGAARMAHQAFSGHPDPSVKEAYNRGREQWVKDERLAREQHPAAYVGGLLAGSLAMPSFGALAPATAGARFMQGARAGGIGGALYGTGEAISEGKSPGEVAAGGARGAVTGGLLGGGFGAAFGPRAAGTGSGARAAATFERLGEPAAKGTVSEKPITQATTSAMMSLPVIGSRIRGRVERGEEAAGREVEDISRGMAGPAYRKRAVGATLIQPGLQAAIDHGRQTIDGLYNGLRSQIDQNAHFTMPRTDVTITRIMRERQAAGWDNPAQGLEQFRNVAGGATFNGAHRARVDAREAGNVTSPHPGYNANDYNQITRAMTEDLRAIAGAAATNQTPAGRRAAVQAFNEAERQFGPMADMNRLLRRIMDSGEGGVERLLGSAGEKSGELSTLTHLRRTMPQQEFETIGGLLLSELGHSPGRNEFSLAQFSTNFNKLSEGAVRTLFSPQHAQNLREIADAAGQMKRALKTASTSHSSNWLAFVDIVKDVALLAHDLGSSGGFGKETAVGLGSTAVIYGLGWMLGNPARSASLAAWTRAYSGLTGNAPTPARIAGFNIATRNLANTLGIPAQRLTETITRRLQGEVSGRAEQEQPSSERPVR